MLRTQTWSGVDQLRDRPKAAGIGGPLRTVKQLPPLTAAITTMQRFSRVETK